MLAPLAQNLACIRVVVPNWAGPRLGSEAWLREAITRELPRRLARALPSLQACAIHWDRFWVTELEVHFKPIGWRGCTVVENAWWRTFGGEDSRSCARISEEEGERIYSKVIQRTLAHRAAA